jgi:glycyl-tRNA synthetase beta chain
MRNIVRKEGGQPKWEAQALDDALLVEPAERQLAQSVRAIAEKRTPDGYVSELLAVAALWPQLDDFFNRVRVNAEDPKLRANRLALLAWATRELSHVADFSQIVIPGESARN